MPENSRRAALETLLTQAIDQGLTTKLACMVVQGDHKFEFHTGLSDPDTLYDLASLTKIFCTTVLTAKAIVDKKLRLEEQPWPQWPGVTIEHVMTHRAGLPPWVEISCLQDVFDIKPIMPPNTQTLYSDMGYVALGALLQERGCFMATGPLHFGGAEPVDDARCRALGGVAGHSGLFGTLKQVFEESWPILKSLVNPETPVERVLKGFAEYPGSRGIGFDKATGEGSTGGSVSEKTVGHLGYTGTSVWIDPVHHAIYILLMRRIDKGSRSKEIMEFRRQFHSQAAKLFMT